MLNSCTSLLAKAPSEQIVAAAEPETRTISHTPASSPASPTKSAAYTDPLVSKQPPPVKQASAKPSSTRAVSPQIVAPQQAESTQHPPVQAPQNSLANVIQQPTAVQAGQNSIFAIANAKVAEAQGVPAYAPVKNINPMAGSVFSARNSGIAQPAPASGSPDKNGLW
ncbi:hypothetical protein [Rhizobium sp. FKY42]|uniref:hypothetical protein n=1 Tax=Rhizobium sp. FKY42 TaxID=2562310 RepID=UPI0010C0A3DD|nr:hypothetical protein [Rhizobium sp. FKY42]